MVNSEIESFVSLKNARSQLKTALNGETSGARVKTKSTTGGCRVALFSFNCLRIKWRGELSPAAKKTAATCDDLFAQIAARCAGKPTAGFVTLSAGSPATCLCEMPFL
ncbi:hypothetical protein L596_007120 [Steinernema carpocapsae]|uniref:Uncharacterized protein n=1 Tax=Steinernema carpocapsae TaxID=34508 RepID=A0A4U5P9B8_STECR|nr:hypothetical protein L596_007120 [Steinernema carpocapsae]